MPKICGIHHLKFPVRDLDAGQSFYERAFGARRIGAFDHRTIDGAIYAIILEIEHLGTYLELRLNLDAAKAQERFDPVTFAVRMRADLEAWCTHLDAAGIAHSPILTGVAGYLLVFDDPDGLRLRLYTLEKMAPDDPVSAESPWLR
jgi:catechol 2,3-dioxygenase-like lactoylglutathione lyase family enzyme